MHQPTTVQPAQPNRKERRRLAAQTKRTAVPACSCCEAADSRSVRHRAGGMAPQPVDGKGKSNG